MANPSVGGTELVRRVAGIFDEYGHLYNDLSASRASNYLDYVRLGKADEEKLIQPALFPEFLSHVLGFQKHRDYVAEKSGPSGKTPDFTPIDLMAHPFLFETKGCDSSRDDLIAEYFAKSKTYLETSTAEFVIITNMVDLVVFVKGGTAPIEDLSFSFQALYGAYKAGSLSLKEKNVARFLAFVTKFHLRELSAADKIKAVAKAKPHIALDSKLGHGYRELETLTESIRRVVDWMRADIKTSHPPKEILDLTEGNPDRRRLIAMEIYTIRHEVNPSLGVPDDITPSTLDSIIASGEKSIKNAMDIFAYRVAYFTMARILLVRAWEDSGFIEEKFQTLYNGGFSRWYFDNLDKQIGRVLRQAFSFAREKYEWLFTENTNYSWYIPSDDVLADILYEFARYNLSVLDGDVLGVVYEEYLDTQDKKNKGQYYTPAPIVRLIWNRLGYGRDRSDRSIYTIKGDARIPQKILDPATGSGSFLVEAARRIRTHLYPSTPVQHVEAMKAAIVGGLYGSEISPFSYYLTEINLLIQLTPISRRLSALDPKRRDRGGRFTLSVIRQDSLSLHNPAPVVTKDGKTEPAPDSYYGFEILKPTGDKLRVFEQIKSQQDFDYVVGNPPYIGEDDHKDLFRRTLALFPYWREYYQGKMDYLYFFVILGLQKLKSGGKFGFITTSYWLTADGASKLRKFILDNARIVEVINFHEVKLFEHAKGQHNIVFVLEKNPNPEVRNQNKIRLVEVHKGPNAPTVAARLEAICRLIESKISLAPFNDEQISVYDAPIRQGELTETAWFLFHSVDDEQLLKEIEKAGTPLGSICDVGQGLISRAHKVSTPFLKGLSAAAVSDHDIKTGDGVFVINNAERDSLGVPPGELSLLRPFYKNSNIRRYVISNTPPKEWVIYTTVTTKIDDYPVLKQHLGKFKAGLESTRDSYDEEYPWFKLHRERERRIFEGPKIVCPYRSTENTFAWDEGSFYGSTDMYFVKAKAEGKSQTSLMEGIPDLKFVLGMLNSKVIRFWTLRKTKRKGRMRELFPTQLEQFPIARVNLSQAPGRDAHARVVSLVDDILRLRGELSAFDSGCDVPTSSLHELDDPPTLRPEGFLALRPTSERITLASSELEVDPIPSAFLLSSVAEVSKTVHGEDCLVLKGKGGVQVLVRGDRRALEFVHDSLVSMKGAAKSAIEAVELPGDMNDFATSLSTAQAAITRMWTDLRDRQKELDTLSCQLYGVDEAALDKSLSSLASEDEQKDSEE